MTKALSLIGAGGHARSLLDLILSLGLDIEGIYDDSYVPNEEERILEIPLKGNIQSLNANENEIVLAVGNNNSREELYKKFESRIRKQNLISKNAVISVHHKIGVANQIFSNVVLNTLVQIGDNNLINTSAIIEHESKIGNHNHISVGTILCGRVTVRNNCFIGAGSVVKDGISICDNVTVGAGSVVIKDIMQPGTYVGNPIRKIK